jgi:hypothetical protein
MITGQLGISCHNCGNSSDPLGVMEDNAGRLVCFWCAAPISSDPPPAALVDAWVIGDDDLIDVVCEDHARQFATDRGLVFDRPSFTEESANGYAYQTMTAGDLESDYPHACSVCGVYLQAALTPEGRQYVRDNYPAAWWPLWGVEA